MRQALLHVAAALMLASGPRALAAESKTLDGFSDVRTEVLNSIGNATKRIWLTTDYLTDGEIVSALYVSQYRKLDVQVLLGKAKANFYMSRLNYLKNQNIPVFLRPDGYKPPHPTMVLCDDRLLQIDGDLDFMTKVRKFVVTQGEKPEADAYAAAFASAASARTPAVARPMPLVGKPGAHPTYGRAYSPGGGTVSSGGGRGTLSAPVPHYDKSDSSGYVYDRKVQPRPEGVPAKLPKDLKWDHAKKAPAGADDDPGSTTGDGG